MGRESYFTFVTEGGQSLAMFPREVSVEQEVGKIDFAEIKTSAIVPGTPAIQQGRPVLITYGRNRDRVSMDAYMTGNNDQALRDSTSMRSSVVLQCLSPASIMRDKKHRAWNGRTIPDVVREVAGGYRFNVVADSHNLKWQVLTQDGESDWAFICSLAKRIGFWPYFIGTTLFFLNPDYLAGRQVPIYIDPTASERLFEHQTQDQPYVGRAQVTLRRGRFTDIATGRTQFFNSTYPPRLPVSGRAPTPTKIEEVRIEAANYSEASEIYNGIERNGAWYMERRLTMEGRTDLHPCRAVFLRSTRVRGIRTKPSDPGWEEYDGLWLVKSVLHYMTFGQQEDFTTQVVLTRDGRGIPNVRQRKETGINFGRRPPSRLLNGSWVSSWGSAA